MTQLLMIAVLIWLPFLMLPVFASLGDTSYPHIAFHVLALPLLLVALVLLARLRSAGRSGRQTAFAWVLSVSVSLCVLGHAVELVIAILRFVQDGFANKNTADIWERGPHAWAASITIPSTFLSMLVVLIFLITTAIQNRRRLDPV